MVVHYGVLRYIFTELLLCLPVDCRVTQTGIHTSQSRVARVPASSHVIYCTQPRLVFYVDELLSATQTIYSLDV